MALGSFTRAWNPKTGTLRFDVIQELRDKYPLELGELTWDNVRQRPDLQIKGVILKSKENYNRFDYTKEPLAFGDAAYNGGISGVEREMRACKLGRNCDPLTWFNNVEKFCLKSKAVHTGGRSACEINRYHVRDVFKKSESYRVYLPLK